MSAFQTDEIYADYPYLAIRWDPLHKCVYAEFKGFANSGEFRAGTLKIIEAIRERRAHSLISDNRRLEGVAEHDQLWLRDTWMPDAVSAGVKRIAVVLAESGLGRVASEDIIRTFGKTRFVTRTFDSLVEAMAWIAETEKKTRDTIPARGPD